MKGICSMASMGAVLVIAGCGSTQHITTTVTATVSTNTSTGTTAANTGKTVPYSGVAPNANIGPATDQSACPGTQVTVGPNTSCPFAQNVATAVDAANHATGHFPATVTAFSPVTGKTYSLRCSISGYGSELVCATLPPATGTVVLPLGSSAASSPTTSTSSSTSTSTPEPSVEGPGSFSHATDAQFCSTHTCIENFPNGSGYIVQCADGEWSHSGGRSGACSDHGGEG